MAVLERPPAGRTWIQRWTVIGAVLFGAAQAAEQSHVLPPGTSTAASEAVGAVGQLLMLLGIYRHVAN